jgi:hypothetical protein
MSFQWLYRLIGLICLFCYRLGCRRGVGVQSSVCCIHISIVATLILLKNNSFLVKWGIEHRVVRASAIPSFPSGGNKKKKTDTAWAGAD